MNFSPNTTKMKRKLQPSKSYNYRYASQELSWRQSAVGSCSIAPGPEPRPRGRVTLGCGGGAGRESGAVAAISGFTEGQEHWGGGGGEVNRPPLLHGPLPSGSLRK